MFRPTMAIFSEWVTKERVVTPIDITYLLHGAECFLRTNRFAASQEILRILC
jgi:hypothetical protein